MLVKLDDLERHPHLYTRTAVQCLVESQITVSENKTVSDFSEVAASSLIDCEVYMLHDYKPSFLSLPFLTSYDHDTFQDRVYVHREDKSIDYDIYAATKDL